MSQWKPGYEPTAETSLAQWEAPPAGLSISDHHEPPQSEQGVINPFQILRKRWRLILTLWLATFVPALAFIWMHFEREYEAEGVIRVAPYVSRILFRDEESGLLPLYGAFVTTQMNLITNPMVLNRVLDDPDIAHIPWIADSDDPTSALSRIVQVDNPRNTELITVTMRGREKEHLAPAVNAILNAYMELVVEQDEQGEVAKLGLLYQKQGDLEKELNVRQEDLYALANEYGTISLDGRHSSALETLQQMTSQLNRARSNRLAAQARLDAIKQQAEFAIHDEMIEADIQDYLRGDAEFRSLINAKVHTEQEMMNLARSTGPTHRAYRTMESRLSDLDRLINDRYQQVVKTVRTLNRQNMEREFQQKLAEAQIQLNEAERAEQTLTALIENEEAKITGIGRQAVKLDALREKVEQTKQLYDVVLQRIQHLEVEKQRPARISIAAFAEEPISPIKDRRQTLTKMAIAGTLFLAVMIGIMVDRQDTCVHCEYDVRRYVGLPVLGARTFSEPLRAVQNSDASHVLDEIRAIRGSVLFAEGTGDCRGLLITSPNPQEGKTTLSRDLAQALAQSGRSVLLIDADHRKRSLTRRFNLDASPGLAELLKRTYDVSLLTYHIEPDGVTFLPTGVHEEKFSELLVRPGAMSAALKLFAQYDHIIVDAPPVLINNEPCIWAKHLDAVVMVLRAGRSTREDAMDAKDRLSQMGARIIGAVLNGVDPRESYRRYSYYYEPDARHEDVVV